MRGPGTRRASRAVKAGVRLWGRGPAARGRAAGRIGCGAVAHAEGGAVLLAVPGGRRAGEQLEGVQPSDGAVLSAHDLELGAAGAAGLGVAGPARGLHLVLATRGVGVGVGSA